jgi:hypothetical protein
MELRRPLHVALVNRGPDTELLVANPVEVSGKGRPLVFYDITLALKNLQRRIFLVRCLYIVGFFKKNENYLSLHKWRTAVVFVG